MEVVNLVKKVESLSKEPRMVWLKGFWERFYSFKEPTKVPVTVAGSAWDTSPFNFHGWSRLLNVNLIEIFEDPKEYLKFILEATIYRYREFKDDFPLTSDIMRGFTPSIPIFFPNALETSLYGIKPIFRIDTDPWRGTPDQGVKPLIREEEDLERFL